MASFYVVTSNRSMQMLLLCLASYCVFFITDFGLSSYYDPTRQTDFYSSRNRKFCPPDQFLVTIHEPADDTIVDSPFLNITIGGSYLTGKRRRKISLEVSLNEISLNISVGNPIDQVSNGPIGANVDLSYFGPMPSGSYRVSVHATLGKGQ